jgi:hypothetical protein
VPTLPVHACGKSFLRNFDAPFEPPVPLPDVAGGGAHRHRTSAAAPPGRLAVKGSGSKLLTKRSGPKGKQEVPDPLTGRSAVRSSGRKGRVAEGDPIRGTGQSSEAEFVILRIGQ